MKTVKDKKDRIRAIIDSYQIGEDFEPEDIKVISDITKTEIKRIKRRINPTFPSDKRHIHISTDNENWSPFSWVKAVVGSRDDVGRSMRFVVKQDMDDFRYSAEQKCMSCGSDEDLTVDHKDISFNQIKKEFLAENGEPELREWSVGAPKIFKDLDLEAKWITYHARRATYQILCRSCNSKKGIK